MPTDVISKIGATNSPVAMDFSSLQSWEDASPPDITAAGSNNRWIGECYDQGTFTAGVVIQGTTVDSTHYTILRCAAGASFNSKSGVLTTALTYNASGGVTIQGGFNLVNCVQDFTQISGLQIKATGYASAAVVQNANCAVSDCIITSGISGTLFTDEQSSNKYINCLFEFAFSTNTAVIVFGQFYNCTFVNVGGSAGSSNAIHTPYNTAIVKNCAVFGFDTFTDSTPASGSDYNATDNSSAVTGSHNQTSLTYSSQFQSTTNDFRAKSQTAGTGLHNGTPDSTNAPADITGATRDAVTPYIGCWEPSAPSVSFTVAPTTIPASHAGNITLTLAGTGTTWSSGSTVSVTNSLTGTTTVTKGTWTRTSNTAATLTVTTSTGAGTYKITVDSVDSSGTLTVGTATLAVSPTTGVVSTTPTLTLTGSSTVWTQEMAAGLFTVSGVSGVSIATPTVTTDTAATAVLTIGTNTGTVTITDSSTGATCTFAVNAVTGTITITNPVQWQTYQRNGSNQATLTIAGTYTGGPGTLTMECSLAGSSYAMFATGSGGTFSGTRTFTVTPGTSNVQGTLTVRFVNATGITATVANVGVGDVFAIAGQSNAVGVLAALQSYSNGAGLKATAYDTTAWVEGNDYLYAAGLRIQGSFWPLFATHHMNDQQVPCCFVACAVGGRSLSVDDADHMFFTKFRPDTGVAGGTAVSFGPGYSHITTVITNSGVNSVKAVLWYQGENEIDADQNRWSHAASMVTFANQLATDMAGAPKLIPMQLGYAGASDAAANAIRLAISDAVGEGGNILGMPTNYDLAVFGGVGGGNALHIESAQDAASVAARFWAACKSELFGGTSGNGHGPRVVGVQYDSTRTIITVSFDKTLKTGLTMDTSLWTVTGNGSGATINSIAYHATDVKSVVLTLSAAATLPIIVSFGLGGSTAGKIPPKGPDFTLPGGAGTINLPAEPFQSVQAAAGTVSEGVAVQLIQQQVNQYLIREDWEGEEDGSDL